MKKNQNKTILSILLIGSLLAASPAQAYFFHPKTTECSTKHWKQSWTKSIIKFSILESLKTVGYSALFVGLACYKPSWAKNVFSNVWGGKHAANITTEFIKRGSKILSGMNHKSKVAQKVENANKLLNQSVLKGEYGPTTQFYKYTNRYPQLVCKFPNKKSNIIDTNIIVDYSPIFGDFIDYQPNKNQSKYDRCEL